ncbi:hypothetical protein B7463_g7390, partial [Scytalidium lignicola]
MTATKIGLESLQNKNLLQTKGLINGKWVTAVSGATFNITNPANLEVLTTMPEMGKEDTAKAIAAAAEAFKTFKKTTGRQRARMLRKWSDLCHENLEDLALILTLENGKPLAESRGEVTYGASFLEWFAGEAERTYGEVVPSSNPNQRVVTFRQPLGVAACLTPWNFPIAMITRKAGAALAAGCTTVWKPAGETPLSALAQAVLAIQAGFPAGSINVITTLDKVAEVGAEFCTNRAVRKKLSLELGGNSPFIVFDDANIETAIEAAIVAKFRNSGQTCVTANRVFVQDGIYDEFATRLSKRIQELKVGSGWEDGVVIGPLTHERAVEKALAHINGINSDPHAKKLGGQVILGGAALTSHPGYFMQPTVVTEMNTKMLVTREETFAPVVGLYRFKTEEEALDLANDCDVGLGSFVCTSDIARMWRVAEALEVGMVGINLGMLSACESPFGGVKESGFGREGGRHGIDEYTSIKSMIMNVAS